LHLAVAELPVRFFEQLGASEPADGGEAQRGQASDTVTVLRSVLMKPEHLDWIDRIWEIIGAAADESQNAVSTRR
jgi:tyrosine decarboxylase / aspartate 1-decarboxylase